MLPLISSCIKVLDGRIFIYIFFSFYDLKITNYKIIGVINKSDISAQVCYTHSMYEFTGKKGINSRMKLPSIIYPFLIRANQT